MKDVFAALSQLHLPSGATLALVLLLWGVREIWWYVRDRSHRRHGAGVQSQLEAERTAREQDRVWFEQEFARLHKVHEEKYVCVKEVWSLVEDFHHFALRVSEGHGTSLRHNATSYCDLLVDNYWKLRDFARAKRSILGEQLCDSVYSLTNAGQPMVDECTIAGSTSTVATSATAARGVMDETKRLRAILDGLIVDLGSLQRPPGVERTRPSVK